MAEKDRKDNLVRDFVEIAVAAPIAGVSIGFVEAAPIPGGLKSGTSAIIATGLLKGSAKRLL